MSNSNFGGLNLDIPIFTKTYELYKTFYGYLPTFPKKDRYTLGQKCESILLDLIEAIICASSLPRQEKTPILKRASLKLDVLKVLFRLGKDLKVIDSKNILFWRDICRRLEGCLVVGLKHRPTNRFFIKNSTLAIKNKVLNHNPQKIVV